MIPGVFDDGIHMIIIQGIVDNPAVPPGLNQPDPLEDRQVMTYRGNAGPDTHRKIKDTEFPRSQGIENLKSGRVCKGLEEFPKIVKILLMGQLLRGVIHHILMKNHY
jgi:hypothetical protein